MKYLAILFALAFACTAQAQTPNVIFFDDFSTSTERDTGWESGGIGPIQIPSEDIWGVDSFTNTGSYTDQWIQVKNDNAETLFGEADNNYMEIWSNGLDGGSMWLLAEEQFSTPSEVITMSVVFNHPGSDDEGPSLRSGILNAVSNSKRSRQDLRFEDGALSGIDGVYELGTAHRMEIVYNNSLDTISYLDGQVELKSDRYDVWIDGELVLKNHMHNTNINSDATLGNPLKSLAFVLFASAQNHLYVDEVVVYDDAFVADPVGIPEPPDEEGLLFADDFSTSTVRDTGWETGGIGPIDIPDEEIWGVDSFENRGSYADQWIQVKNDNAEQLFGEAGNNYMEIWTNGMDSNSMWLLAEDKFNYPSTVLTISMRFNQPAGTSDVGPSFRSGIDAAWTNNKRTRQDARFERGALSAHNDAYELDQPHRMEMVYNNTSQPIHYLDGQIELKPDSYDVWIDGELKLRNHRYNPNTASHARIDWGLLSLAFVVFGGSENHIYVDDIVVYDHPKVTEPHTIPEPPSEEDLLFADDFSNPESDGTPSEAIWGTEAIENRGSEENQWIEVTDENSETLFGEAGNNYLRIYSNGVDEQSMWISAENKFHWASDVVTVSMDFYNAVATDLGPTLRLGVNDPIGSRNDAARQQVRFEQELFSGDGPLLETNRAYNLQLVYNNSLAPVTYANEEATVASDTYDVWIDGELVLSDVQYLSGTPTSVPLGKTLSSWGLGVFGALPQNELMVDNLKIYDGARVTTGGGDGVTFADWAVDEGIPEGERGPEDTPAGDGVANIIKFALGIPALMPAADQLPVTQQITENGEEFLALEFTFATDRAGIELQLQGSTDLTDWVDLDSTIEVLEEGTDGVQLVRMTDTEAMAAHNRRFLRLVVIH